ncbi:tRNA-guanine transglycosylase [Candidatus Parcubacteria bacterium]|nr:tRNA-guanine transglycosylase [Candidatus Parcubacteria bacterium]
MFYFKVKSKSKKSSARIAELKTNHGLIQTPFFMPIATVGAVKTLSVQDLKMLGAQIILSNTYHLLLRPGMSLMKKAGGLRQFMNWPGPILTDSGGFQVYSLSKIRRVTDRAVTFQSHIDGKEHVLTPAKALQIQATIGSDIAMLLDECVGYPAKREEVEMAVERTTLWAQESLKHKSIKAKEWGSDEASRRTDEASRSELRYRGQKNKKSKKQFITISYNELREGERSEPSQLFFAINQGGVYKDLRLKSARDLVKLNYDGYAIGGLAVGEPWPKALKVLDWVIPELPANKPRYLMGVGYPEQIVEAVKRGVDMFDCVIPTREARHGKLYMWKIGRSDTARHGRAVLAYEFYTSLNILNSKFSRDFSPISKNSKIPELRNYTKAYLRHLFKINEPLAQRLATFNNLEFYLQLMARIREEIRQGFI